MPRHISIHLQYLVFPSPALFLFPVPFPRRNISPLNQGNTLNLNRNTLRQLLNSDTAPGRLVREELLVGSVHLSKVVHGGDEHVDLDDLLEGRASSLKDGGEVADALLGHLADVVCGQGEDLAGGSAWDLAGAVDGGAGLDGLGVRARSWEDVSTGFEVVWRQLEKGIGGNRGKLRGIGGVRGWAEVQVMLGEIRV